MNKLPDSIMESCIVPLLPMRDAVETSLICRRWRHLWRHSVLTRPNLEFDHANVFGSRRRENDNLDKFVEKYMKLYEVAKGAEDIQLVLRSSPERYKSPYELLLQGSSSTLKHLALRICVLRPPPADFDGFNNLRSLSLTSVTVDQIFMAHLLSSCLLLESLEIKNCYGLSHLNIVGDRLSDLKLWPCRRIEISAPNLVSLEYTGDFTSISFVTTPPRLAQIVTAGKMLPAVLSCLTSFPELETLLEYVKGCGELPQISSDLTFRNLKKLTLNVFQPDNLQILRSVLDLLKAAPLLEEFIMTLITLGCSVERNHQHETRDNVECSGSFTHDHLKSVELQGFQGNWYEIQFAIWILKNAAKLEILVINPAGHFYDLSYGIWTDHPVSSSSWKEYRVVVPLVQEKLEQVKTSARIIIKSE